jgi:hypothetical protein
MTQQINLLNPALRRQRASFSAATALQSLAGIAAGIVALYAFQAHQNRTLEQLLGDAERQVAQRRDQIVQLSKELSDRTGDNGAVERLARAEERLQQRNALLNEVRSGVGGSAAGFSSYLAALARRTMPGVWLTGIELGKSSELVLKGRVVQGELVPLYIAGLNKEEPFAGLAVSELRLTAREEPPAPAQPAEARGPSSFIEFYMSMPL